MTLLFFRFKASNKGEFPPVTLTVKEVGGSFYTVREILQELKQQHISYDNLHTDLKVVETKNQTISHTIQPLSLPAESANNAVIDNNHILELKEAKYQETLSDTEEKENLIHNDVMETCGLNDQTQAKKEIKIFERVLRTSVAPFVADPQPLQEVTKGQSFSSASNGIIESNQSLERSRALSDPEEQRNIIQNDVMETCGPLDQTQGKQEIKIVERPLGTGAASVAMDLQVLKGQSISGASAVVGDNNHSLELKEAEYLEALSDTKEQKNIIHNDVMATCGQTQPEQEIKIVERTPRTSTVSVVVDVQPVQEVMRGQSISSVSGRFIDNNHSLEQNGSKCQEALLDTKEQKSIIHNDVMETCGPNDQSHETQPLQEVTKEQSSEKEVKNQPRSFILDGNQKNKNTHKTEILFQISETKDVTNRNAMESYSSYVENVKYEASEVNGKECNLTHKMKSSASISLDSCLPEFQSSELGSHSLENPNLLGSLEEMEHAFPTVSENGSMFGTQKLTSSYSPLEKNSSYIESSEGGEEHLPLDASRPLSLALESHSTTCATESPKDVSYSAYHEEDSALAPNSTKRMPEEPANSADKVVSSMTDLVTAPGEANEIPDNILDDQKLASSNITPDQVMIGFKVSWFQFFGIFLAMKFLLTNHA
ncbi:hypothetical protein KI387_006312 [Taxus chinensis]|uniref:AT3G52170-like helix-turn-helix domain-containing protein n=1 Tax=Taxus chinensis TaxID=29808 RepID=A0AA38LJA7_TAXCH|nr:hypothetical protein KI387_006312 [Taxus chinensis]